MRNFLLLAAIAVMALTASAEKSNQIDTLRITTTPEMHCSGCEDKIKSNIRFVKGVKKIVTSVPEQEVTIIFKKDKATFEDFRKAFEKIGYQIERKK